MERYARMLFDNDKTKLLVLIQKYLLLVFKRLLLLLLLLLVIVVVDHPWVSVTTAWRVPWVADGE